MSHLTTAPQDTGVKVGMNPYLRSIKGTGPEHIMLPPANVVKRLIKRVICDTLPASPIL